MKITTEYYKKNREKILKRQRAYYWKDPERYRQYNREYKKNNLEKLKEIRKSPKGIYWYLAQTGQRKISKKDFVKWYQKQKKRCYYCEILEEEIKPFKCWKKINRLQIDRKDNNKPYQKDNIVLACPVCNFIKGNYFTFEEMLVIGKVIRQIKEKKKNRD